VQKTVIVLFADLAGSTAKVTRHRRGVRRRRGPGGLAALTPRWFEAGALSDRADGPAAPAKETPSVLLSRAPIDVCAWRE